MQHRVSGDCPDTLLYDIIWMKQIIVHRIL